MPKTSRLAAAAAFRVIAAAGRLAYAQDRAEIAAMV